MLFLYLNGARVIADNYKLASIFMKSLFNKTILGVFAGAMLFLGAESAQAAQLTQSQVQAVIQLLQSFNADPAIINSVGTSLGGVLSPVNPTPVWCPTLSYNLYVGVTDAMTAGQVSQLQQYLGINPTGYFGTITRALVASLQSQNGVYPVSGGVGPLTRALIQRLCGGVPSPWPLPTPLPTNGILFTLNTQFSVGAGQTATESSLGELTLQGDLISGSSAQVTMGENCGRGRQCFYYPHQTVSMTPNKPVVFQDYTITLTQITGSYLTFYVTKGAVVTPVIDSIYPTSGPVGTVLTIYGSNFGGDNTVRFGSGGAMHVAGTSGGGRISYTIPSYAGPCDYVGDTSQIRCMAAVQQVQPGTYNLSITNANGQSAAVQFIVTGQIVTNGPISFTQPIANQSFTSGQAFPIVWTSASNIPTDASMSLDLYTEAGNKMGTIAILRNDAHSYAWTLPRFPQNYMCTMQYPNGLCGVSIPSGRYYLMATVTSNTSTPNNAAALYGTALSGVFTINQQ